MINLFDYSIIAIIVFLISSIKFIYKDIRNFGFLAIDFLISDIAEGLIIGISWAFSIPILGISNILLEIIYLTSLNSKDNGKGKE